MKTKKAKLKEEAHKIPYLIFICLIIVLLTLTFFNVSFYFFSKPKITYILTDNSGKEILFWRTFLNSHPDYFEGWMQLAKLEETKGNKLNARIALSNAIKINPNSDEINFLAGKIKN